MLTEQILSKKKKKKKHVFSVCSGLQLSQVWVWELLFHRQCAKQKVKYTTAVMDSSVESIGPTIQVFLVCIILKNPPCKCRCGLLQSVSLEPHCLFTAGFISVNVRVWVSFAFQCSASSTTNSRANKRKAHKQLHKVPMENLQTFSVTILVQLPSQPVVCQM